MKKNRILRSVLFTTASPAIWLMIVGRSIRLGLAEMWYRYRVEMRSYKKDADYIHTLAGKELHMLVEDFQDRMSKNPEHARWAREMERK